MSARKALESYQPMREIIEAKLAERSLKQADFLRQFFGADEKGVPKGKGNIQKWFTTKRGLQRGTREKLGEFFNCSPDDFRLPDVTAAPSKPAKPRKPRVDQALLPLLDAPQARTAAPLLPVSEMPPFAFNLNTDGSCNLDVHLHRISADKGWKIMEALKMAGLLGHG